jgi:hypothetical protein
VINLYSDNAYNLDGVISKQGNLVYYVRTGGNRTYLYQCNLDGTNDIELGYANFDIIDFDIK